MKIRFFVVLLIIFFASSCVKVRPWEKKNFTRDHMAFDPEPLESKFERHIEDSREGSGGGYGVGGGGCGCN